MQKFIIELLGRLKTKSPQFFVTLRWIAAIAAVVIGGLQQASEMGLVSLSVEMQNTLASAALFLTGVFGTTFLPKKSATDDGDNPDGPGPGGEPPKPPVKP